MIPWEEIIMQLVFLGHACHMSTKYMSNYGPMFFLSPPMAFTEYEPGRYTGVEPETWRLQAHCSNHWANWLQLNLTALFTNCFNFSFVKYLNTSWAMNTYLFYWSYNYSQDGDVSVSLQVIMVAWSAHDDYVLTAVSDCSVRMWCSATGQQIRSLKVLNQPIKILQVLYTLS